METSGKYQKTVYWYCKDGTREPTCFDILDFCVIIENWTKALLKEKLAELEPIVNKIKNRLNEMEPRINYYDGTVSCELWSPFSTTATGTINFES